MQRHATGRASHARALETHLDLTVRGDVHQFHIAVVGLDARAEFLNDSRHAQAHVKQGSGVNGCCAGHARIVAAGTALTLPGMHGTHGLRLALIATCVAAVSTAAALFAGGCNSRRPVDPIVALNTSPSPEEQLGAIEMLREQVPLSDEAKRALRRTTFAQGFNLANREAAFDLMVKEDRKGLREVLETNIVRMESFEYRRWIMEQIAARGMKDYTTVLVNSWAGGVPAWGNDDRKRPEYEAMAALYGSDKVGDALFAVMMEASPVRQAALRARTWELLMRIGERDRLKELVISSAVRPDDVMLKDIKQLVDDLGILPETREELIWLGKLRQSASPAYWKMAGEALREVPSEQKVNFELRGIPVAMAAQRYAPDLLKKTKDQLFDDLMVRLTLRDSGKHSADFTGWDTGSKRSERLGTQRAEVNWTDLVASNLALSMLDDPKVSARIFDIGDRDHQDRRTEYGGVVRINDAGQWEVVEVRPRVTGSDIRFEAPQELFDQGYTSLFHFHMHAQEFENGTYAGPHMGDFGYANSTRANCLVFTFIRRDTMNVDYYRHGPLVIDLGTVHRP